MTRIEYSIESMYLHCKGHAGGGPAGQDIICAGVSALSMALLNQLNEEEEKGTIRSRWKMEPGEMTLKAEVKAPRHKKTIRDYFKVIIMGLQAMAENYPEHIDIREVQGNGSI